MNSFTKWVLGGVATVAVAGLVFAGPAIAAGNFGPGMMRAAAEGGRNVGPMGNMMAMHNIMAPLMSQMPAMHEQAIGELSTLLGMTPEEITKAMSEGKSMAQLAEEKGVAIGEIRALMTRNMNAFLDKMVEQGQLSREDAGRVKGFMEQNVDSCLSGGMGGMMGGMMSGSANMLDMMKSMMGGTFGPTQSR